MTPTMEKYLVILFRLAIAAIILVIIYLTFIHILPAVGKILWSLPVIFLPFILALIMVILIDPVVNFIEKRIRLPRGLATIISLILVLGILGLIIALAAYKLVGELSDIYRGLSQLSQGLSLAEIADRVERLYSSWKIPLPLSVEQGFEDNIGVLLKFMQTAVGTSIEYVIRFLSALPGVITIVLIATVATFFMSRDKKLIIKTLLGFLPVRLRDRIKGVTSDLGSALVGFLRAEFILISITGLQVMIGLAIMKQPYTVTIGILVGLFDILPVLGPGIVFVPWIGWEFYQGNINFALGLLILYAIITVVRQFLEPKIVGGSIGLHPLATLISLYVGLKALGVVGIVLGPAILVFYQALKRARLLPKWLTHQEVD